VAGLHRPCLLPFYQSMRLCSSESSRPKLDAHLGVSFHNFCAHHSSFLFCVFVKAVGTEESFFPGCCSSPPASDKLWPGVPCDLFLSYFFFPCPQIYLPGKILVPFLFHSAVFDLGRPALQCCFSALGSTIFLAVFFESILAWPRALYDIYEMVPISHDDISLLKKLPFLLTFLDRLLIGSSCHMRLPRDSLRLVFLPDSSSFEV